MKHKYILYLITGICFSCSKENNNTQEITNPTAAESYQVLAAAIDHIDPNSKIPVEEQLISYLDNQYDGRYRTALIKAKNDTKKALLTEKITADEAIDMDEQLNDAGFTAIQKDCITKITALYPLDENEEDTETEENPIAVENIKTGLLQIRNEVSGDLRLDAFQKEQLYIYIDIQYATLGSIVHYFEKIPQAIPYKRRRWKISLKRIVNQVVSVVITTAVSAVISGTPFLPDPTAALIGGGAGFLSGIIDAAQNRCIKICGTGYCNTAWNDCYTKSYITKFTIKYN